MGPEDPRCLGSGARDPRPDEQLLPGLRGEQREAARGPSGGVSLVRTRSPARPRGHARVEGRVGRAGRYSLRTRSDGFRSTSSTVTAARLTGARDPSRRIRAIEPPAPPQETLAPSDQVAFGSGRDRGRRDRRRHARRRREHELPELHRDRDPLDSQAPTSGNCSITSYAISRDPLLGRNRGPPP